VRLVPASTREPDSAEFATVDPFDASGKPLPLLSLPDRTPVGAGDKKVQSYNFRLCVTKNTSNQLPFPKPANYTPATWELLRRYANVCFPASDDEATAPLRGCQFGFPSCNTAPVPNGKYDMNNCGGMSSDFIGQSWHYPEANYRARRTIWQAHRDYQQGLLWTMANDPTMPAAVTAGMKPWGLCKDEFPETGGWAPALYVRAARRLVGERVFTQNTPKAQDAVGDMGDACIGLGNYNFDSHNAQRMACTSSADCMGASPHWTGPFAWDEGDVQVRSIRREFSVNSAHVVVFIASVSIIVDWEPAMQIGPGIYQIPLWVTLPKKAEVSNLLVVAAPSASHVGMSTLRMEPQFMIIGHAAGVVASLAAKAATGSSGDVHAVPNASIHSMLLADGQILEGATPKPRPPPGPPGPPVPKLQANQWLAIDSFFKFETTAGGVTTMMVSSLPRGKSSTYLKKSEVNSAQLPPSELKAVTKGEKYTLATKPSAVTGGYWLVNLKA
jgi:hypothetical protein